MPEKFYPKLKRFLEELKTESESPEKMSEYKKSQHFKQDIVSLRLKKIVGFATAPLQTEDKIKNLTREERFLYEGLRKLIDSWKKQIFQIQAHVKMGQKHGYGCIRLNLK